MESDSFDIVLLNTNKEGAFSPGQKLEALARIKLSNQLTVKGITIIIKGFAKTEWKETFGPNEVIRGTTENYFTHKYPLTPPRTEDRMDVYPPGNYEFPVNYVLPQKIPSTFSGENGIVKYYIAGHVHSGEKSQIVCATDFRVVYPVDLSKDISNALHYSRSETHKVSGLLCCMSGHISMTMSIDRRGYTPGESIVLDGEIENNSGSLMKSSKAALVQKIVYFKDNVHKFKNKETICKVKHESTDQGATDIWNGVRLTIPLDTPTNLERCSIIAVSYFVKIEVEVSRAIPSKYKLAELPIKMGNIPLRVKKTNKGIEREYRDRGGLNLPDTEGIVRVSRSPHPPPKFNFMNIGETG